MKSFEQIVKRIRYLENEKFRDIFETRADLISYLPYELAQEFTDLDEAGFNKVKTLYNRENIIKELVDYLSFAFEKAENQRGLSANRSIAHFENWLFVLEDQELYDFTSNHENYREYGLPILMKIKEKYD